VTSALFSKWKPNLEKKLKHSFEDEKKASKIYRSFVKLMQEEGPQLIKELGGLLTIRL